MKTIGTILKALLYIWLVASSFSVANDHFCLDTTMTDCNTDARAEAIFSRDQFEISLLYHIVDIKDAHILAYLQCVHCATGCKVLSLGLHLRTLDRILSIRRWGGTLQQLFNYTFHCESSKLAGERIVITRNRHDKIVNVSVNRSIGAKPRNASRSMLRMGRKRVRKVRQTPSSSRIRASRYLPSELSKCQF